MLLASWLASLKNAFPSSHRARRERRRPSRSRRIPSLAAVQLLEQRALLSAVNTPPVAATFTLDVTEDQGPQFITLSGDDGNPEFIQQLTYALSSNPAHGTLSDFNATAGTVLYTPDSDYFGPDGFSYTVSDDGATVLSLQGTVTGNIESPGQADQYTFALSQPTTLYFDTLTNDPDLNWTLTGPFRAGVVSGPSFYDWDSVGVNISAFDSSSLPAGNYTLTIDRRSDSTGPYQFRLLDFDSATPMTLGTRVTGSLSPASETDLYQFSAQAGDRIFVDSIGLSETILNARWLLLDPLGHSVIWPNTGYTSTGYYFSDAGESVLPTTGVYTLQIIGSSLDSGEGDYAFNLVPVPTAPTIPLTIGTTFTGDLQTPGASDVYSFNLATDSLLYFDNLTPDYSGYWVLEGPLGRIEEYWANADLAAPVRDLPAGNYTLTMKHYGDGTGPYQFRLSDVASATTISPGVPFTGTLNPWPETDMYQFQATAGDQVYLDVLSYSNDISTARWRLIDPYRRQVSPANQMITVGDIGTITLPVSGTYTLLVEGDLFVSEEGGDYTLNIVPVTVASPTPLIFGETISGNLATPGAFDTYSFTLDAKSQIYIDSLTADSSLLWTLTGPAGTINGDFISGNWAYTSRPVQTLPAGDYTLSIRQSGDTVSGYQFRLLDLANAPSLSLDNPTSGILSPTSGTEVYRFDATAGNQFQFEMLSMTDGLQTPFWRLIGPFGNEIPTSTYFFQTLGPVTIPYSGIYTLLVEGYPHEVTAANDYSFQVTQLEDVVIPPLTGEPLALNSVTHGSIDSEEEVGQYVFTLAEDQFLYLDGLDSNPSSSWTLNGPTGSFTGMLLGSDTLTNNPILSLPPGTYQFSVAAGGTTGSYQFNLRTLASADPLPLGIPLTETLDPGLATHLYQFDANAGERFYFDAQEISGTIGYAQWRLVDPFGRLITSAAYLNGQDLGTITLPSTGTYTLLIEGSPYDVNGSGTYTFNVLPVDEQAPSPVALESIVDGTIAVPGEVDAYAFSLTSSSTLYIEGMTQEPQLKWSLTGPAGTVEGLFIDPYFEGSIVNLPSGNYTLKISRTWDSVGDYRFQLRDLSSATPLDMGIPTTATVGSTAALYQFTAQAGDNFYLWPLETTGDVTAAPFYAIDPNGNILYANYSMTAPVTGVYTLIVRGAPLTPSSTGTIQLEVGPVEPTVTPLVLGEQINGTLEGYYPTDIYTFTLQADTLVFLDLYGFDSAVITGLDGIETFLSANTPSLLGEGSYTLALRWNRVNISFAGFPATLNYRLRLADFDAATPITPDIPVAGTTNPDVMRNTYFYKFNPGDTLPDEATLALHFAWGQPYEYPDSYNISVDVYDQRGNVVSDYQTLGIISEPYYLVLNIDVYSEMTSGFDWTFSGHTRIEPEIQPLTLETIYSGIFNLSGSQSYSFSLTSPAQVTFDALGLGRLYEWSLTGPTGMYRGGLNGFLLVNDIAPFITAPYRDPIHGSLSTNNPVMSLPAGNYILKIGAGLDGSDRRFGSGMPGTEYQFRLRDLTSATSIATDDWVSASITNSEKNLYQFTASAGNRFKFQLSSSPGDGSFPYDLDQATWNVIDEYGDVISAKDIDFWGPVTIFGNPDAPEFTIPKDGTYTLVISVPVRNSFDPPPAGDYTFRLKALSDVSIPALTGTPLVLDSVVNGSIETGDETDDYLFTLTEQTEIYINAGIFSADNYPGATWFNLTWTMTRDGREIASSEYQMGFVAGPPFLTLPAGTYRFSIRPEYNWGPGSYEFSLQTRESGTLLTPGVPVTETLISGNENHLYNFSAQAGDKFYVDFLSLTGGLTNTAWSLLDPYGYFMTFDGESTQDRHIASELNSQVDYNPFTLPYSGTYTLQITGDPNETFLSGDYSFNIIPLLPQQPQPLTSAPATGDVYVQNVNDAPVLDNLISTALSSIDEDAFNNVGTMIAEMIASGGGDKITDVDGDFEGIAVTFTSSAGGTWQYSLDGGLTWPTIGTVNVNNALLLTDDAGTRIRFVPLADFNGSSSIQFVAWDRTMGTAGTTVDVSSRGFATSFSADEESALVFVNPVNDAPVLTNVGNPKLTTIPEDVLDAGNPGTLVSLLISSLTSTGGSFIDVDASALQGIAVTSVDQAHGTWQFTTDNGMNWTDFGAPSASAARLLAATSGTKIRFRPAAGYDGSATFVFVAWDQSTGSNGSVASVTSRGGTKAFSLGAETASITITPVNNAPVLNAAGNPTLTAILEDTLDAANPGTLISTIISNLTSSGGSLTDVDTGAVKGIAVTSVDQAHGTWQFTTDNGTTWTDFGTPTASTARLLASNSGAKMRFRPNPDYTGSATFLFVAWDQTSGTNGGTAIATNRGGTKAFSLVAETGSITITPVNDAPVLNPAGTPSLTSIARNIADLSNPGTLVSQILTNMTNTGGSISDIDAGALRGIAVTSVDQTNGAWQFTTDNGVNWNNFGTTSASAARLLASAAGTKIRFKPNTDYVGNATFLFVAWDQSSGTNGGTAVATNRGGIKPFSLAADTATINVFVPNAAPVLNTSGNPVLTSISKNNPDASNDGTLVSQIIASLTTSGGSITDSDSGALQGIAITSLDQSHGIWQYTTDNGSHWLDFGTPSAATAGLLASTAGTKIRFKPNSGYVGNATFLFVAWDQSTGINGGTAVATSRGGATPFSLGYDTAVIKVV